MGRSYRVGWGPNGVFVHPKQAISKEGASSLKIGTLTMEKVFLFPTKAADELKWTSLPLLEKHLESSGPVEGHTCTMALRNVYANIKNTITVLEAVPEMDLHPFGAASLNQMRLVFQMANALFGSDLESAAEAQPIPEDISYETEYYRKARLSAWLRDTILHQSRHEKASSENKTEDLLHCLLANQIDKASRIVSAAATLCCARFFSFFFFFFFFFAFAERNATTQAFEQRNYFLSALLATAGSNTGAREDIQEQLKLWKANNATGLIDRGLLRIYKLLAGDFGELYP
jgi:hypothetical protein